MAHDRLDVGGRAVLITGAARGIGLASARALAARGARVAMLDLDGEEVERQAALVGEHAVAVAADVTSADAVAAAVADVVERLGGLDVVVANAGIDPPAATALSIDSADYQRVIDVNLNGAWHTVKATLPHVVARRGHLLLVASMYAFLCAPLAAPYTVSKAGVEQLGRTLRIELAAHGATAGVAYFAFIDTPLVRRAFADPAYGKLREAVPAWFTRPIPVERASDAIVSGIERRAARVMAPRWLPLLHAARGALGALDARLARDARVAAAVEVAERRRGD